MDWKSVSQKGYKTLISKYDLQGASSNPAPAAGLLICIHKINLYLGIARYLSHGGASKFQIRITCLRFRA